MSTAYRARYEVHLLTPIDHRAQQFYRWSFRVARWEYSPTKTNTTSRCMCVWIQRSPYTHGVYGIWGILKTKANVFTIKNHPHPKRHTAKHDKTIGKRLKAPQRHETETPLELASRWKLQNQVNFRLRTEMNREELVTDDSKDQLKPTLLNQWWRCRFLRRLSSRLHGWNVKRLHLGILKLQQTCDW